VRGLFATYSFRQVPIFNDTSPFTCPTSLC
jgi:hypothetical protein